MHDGRCKVGQVEFEPIQRTHQACAADAMAVGLPTWLHEIRHRF